MLVIRGNFVRALFIKTYKCDKRLSKRIIRKMVFEQGWFERQLHGFLVDDSAQLTRFRKFPVLRPDIEATHARSSVNTPGTFDRGRFPDRLENSQSRANVLCGSEVRKSRQTDSRE
jgi:hypothetical protein